MAEEKKAEAQALTHNENVEVAALLEDVVHSIDLLAAMYPQERLEATVRAMRGHASHAMAASVIFGPQGLDSASKLEAQGNVYKRFIALVGARRDQMNLEKKLHGRDAQCGKLMSALGM